MCQRSNTYLIAIISLLLIEIVYCEKCEVKSSGMFSYRSKTVCTDIVDQFPNLKSYPFSMYCVNCNVPKINNETVQNFRGDEFNISYSHVKSIDKGAFSTFWPTVKMFKFNNNEIKYIEPGLFKNFTGLTELNFRSNNLDALLPSQFENVATEQLDLSLNELVKLDGFNGLTVGILNISFNDIDEIPIGTFAEVTFRQTLAFYTFNRGLYLQSNGIFQIYPGSFACKGTLETLNLKDNRIGIIKNDTFAIPKLRHLDLTNNRIMSVESGAFNSLNNLRWLILSNNQLSNIPLGLFASLRNLESLKMDKNFIKTFGPTTFSGMPSLRLLNVSINSVETMSDSLLVPLGNLVELDISYNRIQTLQLVKILEHNNKLRKLHINHNFWQCTELIAMYKLMNKKSGSFEATGSDFHVPNLHGIPCSRTQLAITDDLTFEQFLDEISKDVRLEDLYDIEIRAEPTSADKISSYVSSIYYLILFVTILIACSYLIAVFKYVCLFLQKKNIVSKNFTILYNNDADVRLI